MHLADQKAAEWFEAVALALGMAQCLAEQSVAVPRERSWSELGLVATNSESKKEAAGQSLAPSAMARQETTLPQEECGYSVGA